MIKITKDTAPRNIMQEHAYEEIWVVSRESQGVTV